MSSGTSHKSLMEAITLLYMLNECPKVQKTISSLKALITLNLLSSFLSYSPCATFSRVMREVPGQAHRLHQRRNLQASVSAIEQPGCITGSHASKFCCNFSTTGLTASIPHGPPL